MKKVTKHDHYFSLYSSPFAINFDCMGYNVRLCEHLRIDSFPKTKMYDIAEQHGTIDKDFEKMNLLDVVYVPNGLSKEKLLSMTGGMNQKTPKTNRPKRGYLKKSGIPSLEDIECSVRQSFWLVVRALVLAG